MRFSEVPIILAVLAAVLLPGNLCSGCGVPKVSSNALIVNGLRTRHGEWPWHAGIFRRRDPEVTYLCGGTLISREFVLTAAHCLLEDKKELSKRRIIVRLGLHYLDEFEAKEVQKRSVEEIFRHDQFSESDLKNDIALLELDSPIQLSDYVLPVCLDDRMNLTGQIGTAIGWGYTENDRLSPVLKKANLPVIDNLECLRSNHGLFAHRFYQGMLCAGYLNGTSVCNGDSGGGLFFQRNGVWFLGGIVSYSEVRGDGTNVCLSKGYGGFTHVVQYLPWIESISNVRAGSTLNKAAGVVPQQIFVPQTNSNPNVVSIPNVAVNPNNNIGNPLNPSANINFNSLQVQQSPAGGGIGLSTASLANPIQTVADIKCLEYQRYRASDTNILVSIHYNNSPAYRLATIISERFLLSAGTSRSAYQGFVPIVAVFQNRQFKFQLTVVNELVFPGLDRLDTKPILYDLGRNYNQLLPYITCLWADPRESQLILAIWNRRTTLTSGQTFDSIWAPPGPCQAEESGSPVYLRKTGETFYRIAGIMSSCQLRVFGYLFPLLRWIELNLWPELCTCMLGR